MTENVKLSDHIAMTVKLTRQSNGSFLGLCPLHAEKTPSFIVHADEIHFECFSCGMNGATIPGFDVLVIGVEKTNDTLESINEVRQGILDLVRLVYKEDRALAKKLAIRSMDELLAEINEINDAVRALYSKHAD